jgi:hypothetical protein
MDYQGRRRFFLKQQRQNGKKGKSKKSDNGKTAN